jgi:hypothetical protein
MVFFKMNQKLPVDRIKPTHNQQCACGCSAAYDNIDDEQFEKGFALNILPKKYIVIAIVCLIALIAVTYFLI